MQCVDFAKFYSFLNRDQTCSQLSNMLSQKWSFLYFSKKFRLNGQYWEKQEKWYLMWQTSLPRKYGQGCSMQTLERKKKENFGLLGRASLKQKLYFWGLVIDISMLISQLYLFHEHSIFSSNYYGEIITTVLFEQLPHIVDH